MVHTLPDYTTKYKMAKVFANLDDAELAARLGSVNTFDRRGSTIWYDDFESATPKWRPLLRGDRGSIAISAEKCWMGSSSCKFVTGDQLLDFAYITKFFPVPSSTKIGLELHIHPVGILNDITIGLHGDDSVTQYRAQLFYDVEDSTVSYINSGGGRVPLKTDVLFVDGEDIWIPLKLVMDWDTKKYIRAIVEDLDTDLSDQSIATYATTGKKFVSIEVSIQTSRAVAKTMYLDNVILTQNES